MAAVAFLIDELEKQVACKPIDKSIPAVQPTMPIVRIFRVWPPRFRWRNLNKAKAMLKGGY
ncbi:hypothetical protein SpAn4DRAFT_2556 [Sporomusa ovata]|uniref:Uncharacterized protein n=2 Tax=Sporomusa ovata TaxID=2378 RepID=A0A0U1L329_9FIRM|nr:hypothetical protein SpAn4DRAFT_2556 [Sporomusa ovata]